MPFGYSFNFENYLFNKVRHIHTQGLERRTDYLLVNHFKKRIEAKIHFLLHEATAWSPYKSLFGSFELNPRLGSALLADFAGFIEKDLRDKGMRRIRITHHATAYAPQKSEKVKKVLLEHGYELVWVAKNHHIPVNTSTYAEKIHSMERRRLVKCRKMGLKFHREPAVELPRIYDIIQQSRKEQGLVPSLSEKKLQQYLEDFGQDFALFTVKDDQTIYAATITIRVHRNILYNFLPASPKRYHQFSPTVLLMEGLYNYCKEHNYEMLDWGVSTTADGNDQDSLIRFKERMGGIASEKWRFEKVL